ncbi:MAG: bacillithiol system redox-active protein YtxJ [Bacteroidia bacterium]
MNCFEKADTKTLENLLEETTTVVLFKHSYRCSISSVALNRLQNLCDDLNKGQKAILLDVIAQRDLSNNIASKFQIKHESPQLIIVKNGKAVYHASHFDINRDAAVELAS